MENQVKFKRFGVSIDSSRNAVMRPERIKEYIDIIADLGYNCLMLYTADTYEIDGQPYFGHNRGRYSQAELKDLDSYAVSKGIELFPCIQTLAHLDEIFRWPVYGANVRDCDNILLCGEEKTYELIEAMFATLDKCFTSRLVNIGMDEAHMLGRGKYQDLHGFTDYAEIFLKHLERVAKIAEKYGFELLVWGDMFYAVLTGAPYNSVDKIDVSPEFRARIPANVNLVHYDYDTTIKYYYYRSMDVHRAIKDGIWFAGGFYSWKGFAPNNGYSAKVNEVAISSCLDKGIENVLFTTWGDNGAECSRFSLLPCLYYTAQYAKGVTDISEIKEGFKKKFGVGFDDFLSVDLADTPNGSPDRVVDAEKYLLYCDCFMGLFDNMIKPGFSDGYAAAAQKLEKLAGNKEYGLVFGSLAKLCRVLEIKCDLSVRTRKAYEAGDKKALEELIADYDETLSRLDEFYDAYEKLWMWENKPQGFDVQDIRLGGLMRRIKHCRARIEEYVNGGIDRIEELDEPVLDVKCRKDDDSLICYHRWNLIVTSNAIL